MALIHKYNLKICVLMLFMTLACTKESNVDKSASGNVRINIKLDQANIASNTLKSSSLRVDFNTVNDLNVIVYNSNGQNPIVYYYTPSNQPSGLNLPFSNTVAKVSLEIASNSSIYLVGNYGSIINSTDIPTVSSLMNLQLNLPTGNIPDKCVMFAQAIDAGTFINGIKEFNADLKRTLSMITVSLNTKNLRNGVSIKPMRMSIVNVPSTTGIGTNNNKVTSLTDMRTGYSLTDSNWPALKNSVDTTIGANTHTTTGSLAFFTYENMQGNASITSQINKNITQKPYATYLILEALYSYNGVIRGDVTYRFCLGSNITDNYDVERNTHYMISLYLSNWGGALEGGRLSNNTLITGTGEGVNWRVIMNLYNFGFDDTNYNFDSHISTGVLPVRGSSKFYDFQYDPAINTANASEHWILTTRANNTWVPMTTGSADVIKNNKFTYFIKPWRFTDPGFPKLNTDKQYRECSITIQNTNGGNRQTVIFRQWAPIKITNSLYMERFDEGKTSGASNLSWGYNEISRLPSGFVYWSAAGADKNYGFENTIKLGTISPAAKYTMQKGGYDLSNVSPSISSSLFKRAAYHLATVTDMDTVSLFTFDMFNPAHTNLDPLNVSTDYWSSSANNCKGTYYWSYTTHATDLTSRRSRIKKVRAVYRPSKDTP